MKPIINVTCAIIEKDNKVLVAQRSEKMNLPLKWEFPGGKVKNGETDIDCLKREIQEELNLKINILEGLQNNVHEYESISIKLIPFICNIIEGDLILKEHKQIKWLDANDLMTLDFADADKPILKEYLCQKKQLS